MVKLQYHCTHEVVSYFLLFHFDFIIISIIKDYIILAPDMCRIGENYVTKIINDITIKRPFVLFKDKCLILITINFSYKRKKSQEKKIEKQ